MTILQCSNTCVCTVMDKSYLTNFSVKLLINLLNNSVCLDCKNSQGWKHWFLTKRKCHLHYLLENGKMHPFNRSYEDAKQGKICITTTKILPLLFQASFFTEIREVVRQEDLIRFDRLIFGRKGSLFDLLVVDPAPRQFKPIQTVSRRTFFHFSNL